MNHHVAVFTSATIGAVAGWLIGRSQRFSEARQVLRGNQKWMTEQDLCLVSGLIASGHGHLLAYWPPPGTDDDVKRDLLMMVLASMNRASRDLEKFRLALIQPPSPHKYAHFMEDHGIVRDDPYYWMRDDFRKNPLVKAHLKAENQYVTAVMADTQALQKALYNEMQQRIPEEDVSVPLRHRTLCIAILRGVLCRLQHYYYYTKSFKGKDFKIHCRRKVRVGAGPPSVTDTMDLSLPEEILLDENKEARGLSFFQACGLKVSPDETLLAYFQDTNGNEFYALKIKEIASGKHVLKSRSQKAWNQCEWSADSSVLFYLLVDAMGRPCQVWRHYLREPVEEDTCIFFETDPAFSLSLSKTRDLSTICLGCESKTTRECRIFDTRYPEGAPRVVIPRERNVKYWLERYNNSYFFRIQDQARLNSEMAIASVDRPQEQTILIPCHPDRKIEDFVVSLKHLTIFCRGNGLQTAFVYALPRDIESVKCLDVSVELKFEEPSFSLRPGTAPQQTVNALRHLPLGPQGDFESEVLRLIFTSLVTPESVIDQHLQTFEKRVKKMKVPFDGYNETVYQTERTWALASDGVRIPISVVFRVNAVQRNGTDPLLLEVYGACEHSLSPSFSSKRLSLLNHGVVYAIAHVRGGGEMGREWYENGRQLKKMNTFTDIVACARHLVDKMYCSPTKLCISGTAAGGLAVGAVVNKLPELFCAAILHSPMVDVLTSMRDATGALSAEQQGEWGNLQNEEDFRYVRSYSPMDNIVHQRYPHMLLTAGYHDFRHNYWEPAKFAAKLREFKINSSMVLFKSDMRRGRFSRGVKTQKYKDAALDYAFVLKAIGHLPLERAHENGRR